MAKEKVDIDELKTWHEFKEGSELAFSEIFNHYYSVLYNYGNKLTQDEALTKDCIQELFITLWNSRETLGEAGSIKFYLLKSLRRKVIRVMKYKKKKFEYKLNDNYEFEVSFSIESLIIKEQHQKEQQEYFLKLLNNLSKRQKEAVYLKFYQDLSYDEISEVMDVNYQSVRNYIFQAITILRQKIDVPVGVLFALLSYMEL